MPGEVLVDVESEIDLLQYLKANGASVSFPIADKQGNAIQTICAPEGERYAALFSYAEGSSLMADMTMEQSRITGKRVRKDPCADKKQTTEKSEVPT